MITLGRIDSALADTGIDLLDITKPHDDFGNDFIRLKADDRLFAKFLWHYLDHSGDVGEGDLRDAFNAETINRAHDAFQESLENFIQARNRAWQLKGIRESLSVIEKLVSGSQSGGLRES